MRKALFFFGFLSAMVTGIFEVKCQTIYVIDSTILNCLVQPYNDINSNNYNNYTQTDSLNNTNKLDFGFSLSPQLHLPIYPSTNYGEPHLKSFPFCSGSISLDWHFALKERTGIGFSLRGGLVPYVQKIEDGGNYPDYMYQSQIKYSPVLWSVPISLERISANKKRIFYAGISINYIAQKTIKYNFELSSSSPYSNYTATARFNPDKNFPLGFVTGMQWRISSKLTKMRIGYELGVIPRHIATGTYYYSTYNSGGFQINASYFALRCSVLLE